MSESPNQLVEHFFRYESAKLIAMLTRAFGMSQFELVEDMVQAAMLTAMNSWKQNGIPDNPAAWIHRVAKNRIIDALRQSQTQNRLLKKSEAFLQKQEAYLEHPIDEEQISDNLLRMMFVCCHPSLDRECQIALALKTLCGFSVSEIAKGLLLPKETIKKRIQRARFSLKSADVKLELPKKEELQGRLHAIHDLLYVMFNEGYSTSASTEPIRDDICEEAARLCHLLCESDFALASTNALMALLLFQSSRLEARTDQLGDAVLLEDQDRSIWDHRLISSGHYYFEKSKCDSPTTLHYEAAIALQYCTAPSLKETPWPMILQLYSRLIELYDSPIYRLNSAIALSHTGKTKEALTELLRLKENTKLKDYPLLDCALAFVHELRNENKQAIQCYENALTNQAAPHEKSLILQKLARISESAD